MLRTQNSKTALHRQMMRGATALALILMLGGGLAGQELKHPPRTPEPDVNDQVPGSVVPRATQPRGPTITLTRKVNLVTIEAVVRQGANGYVSGLTKGNFQILEDHHPQPIKFFSAEQNTPITLALLLDTSPSQGRLLPEEQQVADDFFERTLRPSDLALVESFDVNIDLRQDFTSSLALLKQAIDGARVGGAGVSPMINPGTFPGGAGGGGTHLWDSIVSVCTQQMSTQVGRKAILVITDGEDQGSVNTPQDALRAALDANAVVYAIVAADPAFYDRGMFYRGAGELNHIAEVTGGRSFTARPGKMSQAFAEIRQELRSQYTLAYTPPEEPKDGKFRSIEVKVSGPGVHGMKVQARKGYYPAG